MNILPNDDDKSGLFFDKTCKPVAPDDRSSLMFWFKRSDFYIVGLDFVFCRIALICQSTAITFYLVEVCGYVSSDVGEEGESEGNTPYQMALAPAISFAASLIWSIFIQVKLQRYHQHSKYKLFLYSIALFVVGGVILWLLGDHKESNWVNPVLMYTAFILQGAALANMLNTSTSLISEMIG